MIQKNSLGTYHSSLLTSLGVFHGYSSRLNGDMRSIAQRNNFISKLSIQTEHAVFPQQVHGSAVRRITSKDFGSIIPHSDGLVYKNHGGKKSMILGIHTADCVPILAIDPSSRIIGTAHAGWRGTYAGVAKILISSMIAIGADVNNIYISIGPYIGMCCYNVPHERAIRFQKKMGTDHRMTKQIKGRWYLDLGYVNRRQLLDSGIPVDRIDESTVCTSCKVKEFYSYRKDTKETFGEQIGFIGFVN